MQQTETEVDVMLGTLFRQTKLLFRLLKLELSLQVCHNPTIKMISLRAQLNLAVQSANKIFRTEA